MRTLVFIVLLCSLSYHCVGYNVMEKDTAIFKIDTTYIKTFKTKFGIKPQLKSGALSTRYGVFRNYIKTTSYSPLVPGLTLTYRNFDLSFSINAFRKVFKEYIYAPSKLTDFSFNYYRKKLVLEVILRKNTGFYTRVNTLVDDNRLRYSAYSGTQSEYDLGLNFNYIANAKHFSYKAAFFNSAKQLKSCGSIIYSIVFKNNSQNNLGTNEFASNRDLIPAVKSNKLHDVEATSIISLTSLFPRIGYAYTYVNNNFYASGGVFAEAWRPKQQWTQQNRREDKRYWYTKSSVHLQSGFNWNKWYAGITYNSEVAHTSWHSVPIRKQGYNFAIMGGYRIIYYYNPNKK